MDKGNNWELIVIVAVVVIVIGASVWAIKRNNQKRKSCVSLETITANNDIIADERTIYHVFDQFKNALNKEGLIRGNIIYSIR